jgi:hypothetical protein
MLGKGNWRCIDGAPNGISIDQLPDNFVVRFPLTRIDARGAYYYEGQTVNSSGYATGWLVSNLPDNECAAKISPVTRAEIDQLIGAGNWQCLTEYPTGVIVANVTSGFVVRSPILYVDKDDRRYYKGETLPGGGPDTVWFPLPISKSECP